MAFFWPQQCDEAELSETLTSAAVNFSLSRFQSGPRFITQLQYVHMHGWISPERERGQESEAGGAEHTGG